MEVFWFARPLSVYIIAAANSFELVFGIGMISDVEWNSNLIGLILYIIIT